ncbi:uncharacterized protein L203_105726 [Cryptococcus depauperatus CBS 7841]|uniref:Arf/Sar family protein n=1 Tax=Cryptococcus depauperatus CBS 7841 TaxID=1295531 RepID=A0AAJ8M2U6_9TREE
MYHLIKGLHEYLTRREEYSVVIIGLDNAGKTTMLEKIKTMYNPTPGMPPEKIGPTVGQNIGKISLPSTTLHFYDLGGQRDIRSIWEKYYDECHAVVFVLDATDQARLSETWEVFDEVLNSPRLLNLPLLLLANKQDSPTSLSVAEIRESFEAWQRSLSNRESDSSPKAAEYKGKGQQLETSARKSNEWDDGGAKAERMASLDVMGASALEGTGIRDAVNWLYIRVQNARKIEARLTSKIYSYQGQQASVNAIAACYLDSLVKSCFSESISNLRSEVTDGSMAYGNDPNAVMYWEISLRKQVSVDEMDKTIVKIHRITTNVLDKD